MAVNLSAVFRVRDEGTSRLRRIMQQTERLSRSTQQATRATDSFRDSNGRLRDAMGRYARESNRASSANGRFATSLSGVRVGASGVSASLSGMQSALVGIVGAYVGAAGAAKAFESTIGAAMKLEASEVAIDAIFNDKAASNAYMDMVKKMAVDSPVLSQNEMLSSSKGLIAMTKNVDDLGKAWSIVEKLQVLDPTQGTEGASFALKEMWQGDSISMYDRFGLNKGELNRIKKLDIPSQITEITKLLDQMGITEDAVERMGQTSMASWNGVQERFQSFMQTVGGEGNKTMGKFYRSLSSIFDSDNATNFATKLGGALNGVLTKAIEVGEFLWKWREPLIYVAGAVGAALTAFMAIAAISLLTNPISLIAAGIGAVAVGLVALYKNSEKFRGAIGKIIGRVKALYQAFQAGGTGGLLDAMFGDGTAEKVAGIIDTIKTKFGELQSGFEIVKNALAQGWELLNDIFTNAWTIIGPILSGMWSVLQIVGDVAIIVFNNVIAPALSFLMQLFTTLWAIAQPILSLLASNFKLLATIIKWVWDTVLAPLVDFILTGVKNAFDSFSEALEVVAGWFDKLSGFADTARDKLSEFTEFLSNISLPDWLTNGINTTVSFVGEVVGAKPDGSHYHGLDYVRRDGYIAKLHRGEKVLPAQEADVYRKLTANGGDITSALNPPSNSSDIIGAASNDYSYERVAGGITNHTTNNTYNNTSNQMANNDASTQGGGNSAPIINIAKMEVRKESDIEAVAYRLAKYIEREAGRSG